MKISKQWLEEWVKPNISTDALVEQLTMAGLEVDAVESLGEAIQGVTIGRIVKAEQHPNADKLQVCEVDVAEGDNLSIICGAPNARAGLTVAVATIGTTLPGDFKIKKAKLRGVESHGMLCSEKELQISEESDGIMELPETAPIGGKLIEFLALNDTVIDIDLTPNRGDCLSIRGIAREVGVLNQAAVTEPHIKAVAPTIDDTFPVALDAPAACPRYVGRVIKNIDTAAKTPAWMVQRLEACGVRAIEPSVDVTNYVLLELGHPMHAFDLNNLEGGIQVRMAKAGEKLTLLDESEVELTDDTLLIADHQKPLAIAGVMGGADSGISQQTRDVFLESAYFDPIAIAGKARSYGLHTDASHRYERGVDFNLQMTAMERATQLLIDIVGGEPGPVIDSSVSEHLPKKDAINLRRKRIAKLLGIELSDEQVVDILERLGMELSATDDGWKVQPPSYRFDIAIEEDLIEELVRIYGYNRVPSRVPQNDMKMVPRPERLIAKDAIREVLVDRGYQEAITYSFVEPDMLKTIVPDTPSIDLLNPISSDLATMRTSLLPGLIATAQHNLNRQQDSIKIFEMGLRFENHDDGLKQIPTLAGLVAGFHLAESWEGAPREVDFYDLKGDLESVINLTVNSEAYRYKIESQSSLHPGQSARIYLKKRPVGWIGKVHPSVQKQLDIEPALFVFEIDLSAIEQRKLPKFADLARSPSIRRDLALIVDESVSSAQLVDLIRQTGGNLLKSTHVFDIYRGDSVGEGKKSVAIAMVLQHAERTLKDAEVTQITDKIVERLKTSVGAVLRD